MKEIIKKKIAVLGSTGSVGTQTLDVIKNHSDAFQPVILAANNNIDLLIRQALEFQPHTVIVANKKKYPQLQQALQHTNISTLAGTEDLIASIESTEIDVVVNAITGYAGLKPTIAAVKSRKKLAIANKESLVVAGEIIMTLADAHNTEILPVDSEHSAIFQCLRGNKHTEVDKIILTASGGPFRKFTAPQLATVTKHDALKHPNWSMGAKITVDSATMMNKGLEMIEAKSLFRSAAKNVQILIHPQSIVHSLVQFRDASILAQLSAPDMRLPVLYALAYPDRIQTNINRLDLLQCGSLTFEKPDLNLFPCLELAFCAAKDGGNMPCALNAANETAVEAFLNDKIKFTEISKITERVMAGTTFIQSPSLTDLDATDRQARILATQYV
ncbi:MAG: 1-deoxy-D-xylulose-5-phosphate reductoisomerase [Dysgonamonadaceae bacterium]|jgi:1-deoxy-D-xylulose-5-phosphate reductoisomerase|nr:1-deoxy-D-xylulose-5-phosphate reductoisomerase [Dysgonamonadaceae bacterium]